MTAADLIFSSSKVSLRILQTCLSIVQVGLHKGHNYDSQHVIVIVIYELPLVSVNFIYFSSYIKSAVFMTIKCVWCLPHVMCNV